MTDVALANVEETEVENPALDAAKESARVTNAARTGKGTRVKAGQTRGRNPLVISYEFFDEKLPETLPTTLSEFMEVAKVNDENRIVAFLIDGFNLESYSVASDPIFAFVESSWPDDVQKQFRLVVRNYANATGVSIDDAVTLIKPGIVAAMAKAAGASK